MKKAFINKSKLFIAIIAATLTLVSCETDSSSFEKPVIEASTDPNQIYPLITKQVPYQKAEISSDVLDLIFDETEGKVDVSKLKDSLVIYIEGGPTHQEFVKNEFKVFKEGLLVNGYGNFPKGYPNHSMIAIRQMHNINPTVFGSGLSFTPENAHEVNIQTMDIIEKVVSYFLSKKKVVYLFGHSNGSYMLQDYLASTRTKPSYAIASGTRADVNPDVAPNYLNFKDMEYIDGITLHTKDAATVAKPYFNVVRYLQMDHNKDYTNLLKNNAYLSKLFYGIGLYDEAVGRPSAKEFSFIEANCPHVYFPEGSHTTASTAIAYALAVFRKK